MALEVSTSGNTASTQRTLQRDEIRCYACVVDDGFCVRANTLASYDEANRQVRRVYCICLSILLLRLCDVRMCLHSGLTML